MLFVYTASCPPIHGQLHGSPRRSCLVEVSLRVSSFAHVMRAQVCAHTTRYSRVFSRSGCVPRPFLVSIQISTRFSTCSPFTSLRFSALRNAGAFRAPWECFVLVYVKMCPAQSYRAGRWSFPNAATPETAFSYLVDLVSLAAENLERRHATGEKPA